MSKVTCPNCEAELINLSNFCPNCGSGLQIVSKNQARITPLKFLSLVVASLALFLLGWVMQSKLSGKKPEKLFSAAAMANPSASNAGSPEFGSSGSAHGSPDYNDPELEKIRQLAKEKPLDIDLQKNYSKLLIQKLRQSESPPQALIFETIDVLRNILNLNSSDPDALIAMADISFDQQAFGKAIEFYKSYLDVQKDDLNARARYASSLTFVGKHDEALSELNAVLKKDPKNFHAKAYTAITYAQMGKVAEARKYGKQAVELAPSPEAKERFSQFLAQLDAAKPENQRSSEVKDTGTISPVIEYIKSSQVAGPKYRSYEVSSNKELIIYFENFPMEAMPPVAKEKFFNSLKEAAKNDPNKPVKIIFKDIASPDKELDAFSLK